MREKCKGNTIIEVLVSLAILMIASMMVMTSIIAASKSKVRRDIREKLNRVSYCIMNEIKYNYTYNDVIDKMEMFNNGNTSIKNMGFKYSDDILEILTKENLFTLESGREIMVEIVSGQIADSGTVIDKFSTDGVEKNRVEMKININLNTSVGEIRVEREFNKSWWMENYEI